MSEFKYINVKFSIHVCLFWFLKFCINLSLVYIYLSVNTHRSKYKDDENNSFIDQSLMDLLTHLNECSEFSLTTYINSDHYF